VKAGWVLFNDTLLTSWRLLGSKLDDKVTKVNWKIVGEEMAKCPFKILSSLYGISVNISKVRILSGNKKQTYYK